MGYVGNVVGEDGSSRVAECEAGMLGQLQLDASFEMLDAGLETFHNLANAAHLVEFNLQLVDFAENLAEAGDFGVGSLDRVACAVVLGLRRRLRLLRELYANCQP